MKSFKLEYSPVNPLPTGKELTRKQGGGRKRKKKQRPGLISKWTKDSWLHSFTFQTGTFLCVLRTISGLWKSPLINILRALSWKVENPKAWERQELCQTCGSGWTILKQLLRVCCTTSSSHKSRETQRVTHMAWDVPPKSPQSCFSYAWPCCPADSQDSQWAQEHS